MIFLSLESERVGNRNKGYHTVVGDFVGRERKRYGSSIGIGAVGDVGRGRGTLIRYRHDPGKQNSHAPYQWTSTLIPHHCAEVQTFRYM